ncbi:acyl carrier protein [Pelomonas sp. SE-A7]|uniref:acyl carrier protein n=1 Tax=Pelomonas sp. SE-A7 TaxID=3054953 RepID=UPI00259D2D8B|nr:acyl carrier protein [Pelomonas sp. SE-A7]MDM4764890.1 acyl carrier protein [Pelomonas sp. SE-A7]
MSKNVEQTIKEVMAVVLNIDANAINDDTSMDNTPGWDSANHINLVLALEDEFSISFEVAEFELMRSYFDIVGVVGAKL